MGDNPLPLVLLKGEKLKNGRESTYIGVTGRGKS